MIREASPLCTITSSRRPVWVCRLYLVEVLAPFRCAHAVTRLDVTALFKRIFFTRNSFHNMLAYVIRSYRVGRKSCSPYPASRVALASKAKSNPGKPNPKIKFQRPQLLWTHVTKASLASLYDLLMPKFRKTLKCLPLPSGEEDQV